MDDLDQPAETAVKKCMNLTSTESCLVVTDEKSQSIGESIYQVAEKIARESAIIRYDSGEQVSEEPPSIVSTAMRQADVVFAPTANSLSHTQARSSATNAGARVATLPAITEEVFKIGLAADYSEISKECNRIYEQVSDADTIRITTKAGTDISFELGDRDWFQDTGTVHNSGEMTNLPAGEVFISPVSGDGTFVVDGTMRPHGLLKNKHQINIKVKNGYVTSISDDEIEAEVQRASESVGEAAYNLAELGIGTNTGVTELMGSVLLDEKAAGTVHIAIGDDHAIGGNTEAPIHLDGVIRNPTVYADGRPVQIPEGV